MVYHPKKSLKKVLDENFKILKEQQEEATKELTKCMSYLQELIETSLPMEIKIKNIEFLLDVIDIKAKKDGLEKIKQVSKKYGLPRDEVIENTEIYLKSMERRWVIYGNPLGSDAGNEIVQTATRQQISDVLLYDLIEVKRKK